LGKG
jgi:hypothetical protein